MATPNTPPPRSFTIRVPNSLYLDISDVAHGEDQPINVCVNNLLRLGLGKHVDLNETLRRMVVKLATQDDEEGHAV